MPESQPDLRKLVQITRLTPGEGFDRAPRLPPVVIEGFSLGGTLRGTVQRLAGKLHEGLSDHLGKGGVGVDHFHELGGVGLP